MDTNTVNPAQATQLPPADPDPTSPFGIDKNVNTGTIDAYLGLDDTVYRDMRMVFDPAGFDEIGGSKNLDYVLEGAKIAQFPYVGTLSAMPVPHPYAGDRLFDIEWGEGLDIVSVKPRYEESMEIIADLFPKDKRIVLICGAGGYAGMTRAFLIKLGYDPTMVYNAGGMWGYDGDHAVQLIAYDAEGTMHPKLWRGDIAQIDFDTLTPIA